MTSPIQPFTVRHCAGWCVEVTFPSDAPGSMATHLVVNFDENERRARQMAESCNRAVAHAHSTALKSAADRLEATAEQCMAGGHTSRGRMLKALAKELVTPSMVADFEEWYEYYYAFCKLHLRTPVDKRDVKLAWDAACRRWGWKGWGPSVPEKDKES
jgi:hypothetical protein